MAFDRQVGHRGIPLGLGRLADMASSPAAQERDLSVGAGWSIRQTCDQRGKGRVGATADQFSVRRHQYRFQHFGRSKKEAVIGGMIERQTDLHRAIGKSSRRDQIDNVG
nr:hypothetical protein [Sphingobium sp. AntQ-1]